MNFLHEMLQMGGSEMSRPGGVLAVLEEEGRESETRPLRNPAPGYGRPDLETGGAVNLLTENRQLLTDPVSGLAIL